MDERIPTVSAGYSLPPDRFQDYLAARGLSGKDLPPETATALMLCAGCAEGDGRAWEAFYTAFRPFLRQVALRATGNSDQAEDLLSQTLTLLMEKNKLAGYTGRGSFRGWLRAVIVNLFLDERRRQARARLESLEELTPRQTPTAPIEEGCEKHFRREQLESIAAHLAGLLRRLPGRQAAFLNLYYFQDQTLAEAAKALGVHESTASRWNDKILRRLQKELIAFLRRERRWNPREIADFLDRCLEYLAGRLEWVRRRLSGADRAASFGEKDV